MVQDCFQGLTTGPAGDFQPLATPHTDPPSFCACCQQRGRTLCPDKTENIHKVPRERLSNLDRNAAACLHRAVRGGEGGIA